MTTDDRDRLAQRVAALVSELGAVPAPESGETLCGATEERELATQLESIRRARVAAHEQHTRLDRLNRAHIAVTDGIARMDNDGLASVLQIVVDEARAIAGARLAVIAVDANGAPFDTWAFSGAIEDLGDGVAVPRTCGLFGEAAHHSRARRVRGSAGPARDERAPSLGSVLAVPVIDARASVGTLYLVNKLDADDFSSADEVVAATLAQRASVALRMAGMMSHERARLELLGGVSRLIGEPRDVDAILDQLARLAVPSLGDFCAIHLVGASGTPTLGAASDGDDERSEGSSLERGGPSTMSREVFEDVVHGRRARVERSTLFLPLCRHASVGARRDARMEPSDDGAVLGVLELSAGASGRRYGASQRFLAGELAHHATLAIESARLRAETARALKARDDLLAFVSHDLRNVLGSILIGTTLLGRTGPSGERRRGKMHVDAIRRAADRMDHLISALRDVGMIEAGRFRVERRPDLLGPMLVDALETFGPRAEIKGVRIELVAPEELPSVSCDRERVHQVLANLLGNAVDHTPSGGHVSVEVSELDDRTVQVSVSDTGPGVAPEDLSRLFDPYWRRSVTGRKGTGLGLYIAKGIVDAHGGRLWAKSVVGLGTTFSFTLPAVGPVVEPASSSDVLKEDAAQRPSKAG